MSAVNFFQYLISKPWIRIGIKLKMLDPDLDSMNPEPKHWGRGGLEFKWLLSVSAHYCMEGLFVLCISAKITPRARPSIETGTYFEASSYYTLLPNEKPAGKFFQWRMRNQHFRRLPNNERKLLTWTWEICVIFWRVRCGSQGAVWLRGCGVALGCGLAHQGAVWLFRVRCGS